MYEGRVTLVEVEEIVSSGSFDPDCIHTLGIDVDVNKTGESQILTDCRLPPTVKNVVDLMVSDLRVPAVDKKVCGLTLLELAPDVTSDMVVAKTGAPLDARFAAQPIIS